MIQIGHSPNRTSMCARKAKPLSYILGVLRSIYILSTKQLPSKPFLHFAYKVFPSCIGLITMLKFSCEKKKNPLINILKCHNFCANKKNQNSLFGIKEPTPKCIFTHDKLFFVVVYMGTYFIRISSLKLGKFKNIFRISPRLRF